MRILATLALLLLAGAASAEAQRAAPTAVRVSRGAGMHERVMIPSAEFHGERVLFGAVIGAIIVAPIGGMIAAGACESPDCNGWEGARYGAAVGAILGGLFGLVLALPRRGN